MDTSEIENFQGNHNLLQSQIDKLGTYNHLGGFEDIRYVPGPEGLENGDVIDVSYGCYDLYHVPENNTFIEAYRPDYNESISNITTLTADLALFRYCACYKGNPDWEDKLDFFSKAEDYKEQKAKLEIIKLNREKREGIHIIENYYARPDLKKFYCDEAANPIRECPENEIVDLYKKEFLIPDKSIEAVFSKNGLKQIKDGIVKVPYNEELEDFSLITSWTEETPLYSNKVNHALIKNKKNNTFYQETRSITTDTLFRKEKTENEALSILRAKPNYRTNEFVREAFSKEGNNNIDSFPYDYPQPIDCNPKKDIIHLNIDFRLKKWKDNFYIVQFAHRTPNESLFAKMRIISGEKVTWRMLPNTYSTIKRPEDCPTTFKKQIKTNNNVFSKELNDLISITNNFWLVDINKLEKSVRIILEHGRPEQYFHSLKDYSGINKSAIRPRSDKSEVVKKQDLSMEGIFKKYGIEKTDIDNIDNGQMTSYGNKKIYKGNSLEL